MNKILHRLFEFQRCLLLFALITPIHLFAQDSTATDVFDKAHLLHHHPLPLVCAKIKVGTTKDQEVQSLYGTGVANPSEGHGGARYFIDKQKKCQLRVVIGVDHIIEEVSLTTAAYPFDATSIVKEFPMNAMSSLLSTSAIVGDSIHLGDSPAKILKKFGKPNSDEPDENTETITYEDTNDQWEDILHYSAVFTFRNNKLVRVNLYNGE